MSFIVTFLNDSVHLFTIMERCVALKKITSISQRSRSHLGVQRSNACPGHSFVFYCEILKSFGTFVHHHWTVCRAKELRRYFQEQGHNLSLKVKNGHNWACLGNNYVVYCAILKSLALLFTIIWQCVARKNYVDIFKLKVVVLVQRSKMAINYLVWAINMSFIVRF